MAKSPKRKRKTFKILEVDENSFSNIFDYLLEVDRLKRQYDEVHVIWRRVE